MSSPGSGPCDWGRARNRPPRCVRTVLAPTTDSPARSTRCDLPRISVACVTEAPLPHRPSSGSACHPKKNTIALRPSFPRSDGCPMGQQQGGFTQRQDRASGGVARWWPLSQHRNPSPGELAFGVSPSSLLRQPVPPVTSHTEVLELHTTPTDPLMPPERASEERRDRLPNSWQ